MSYQSEAQLEQQLIDDLCGRDYERVTIKDMDALLQNFREQLNAFNKDKLGGKHLTDKEFERVLLGVDGKSVYQSAKILRDKLLLNREDGTQIYLELFDGKDYKRNIFQITNQVTVKQKYTNFEIDFNFSPTLFAAIPLIPVSISSKMIVGNFTSLAINALIVSITRAISPPDATDEIFCNVAFLLAENRKFTLSMPNRLGSFRFAKSTRN